jgi:prefoldin subunit 5
MVGISAPSTTTTTMTTAQVADADTVSRSEIQQKVEEYATFLRQVLRPDYEALARQAQETQQEIVEYEDLRLGLERLLPKNNHAQDQDEEQRIVDLGHQKVFCAAVIENTEYVYVHVGKGFHVELTLPEALEYITRRLQLLSGDILPYREAKVQKVMTHIRSSELILDQLSIQMAKSEL